MAKHTQTIRRQIADKLSVVGHFDNLALKALKLLSLRKVSQIESCNENSLERFIQYPVKHLRQSFL